jgi:hypothetical protein
MTASMLRSPGSMSGLFPRALPAITEPRLSESDSIGLEA